MKARIYLAYTWSVAQGRPSPALNLILNSNCQIRSCANSAEWFNIKHTWMNTWKVIKFVRKHDPGPRVQIIHFMFSSSTWYTKYISAAFLFQLDRATCYFLLHLLFRWHGCMQRVKKSHAWNGTTSEMFRNSGTRIETDGFFHAYAVREYVQLLNWSKLSSLDLTVIQVSMRRQTHANNVNSHTRISFMFYTMILLRDNSLPLLWFL